MYGGQNVDVCNVEAHNIYSNSCFKGTVHKPWLGQIILLVWNIVIVCVLTKYFHISYHRTKFQRLSNNDFELNATS
jgi:hypothetical protein